ncbi:hypothetical protein CIHG_07330 [Coccidioides immitis H538.4]|uniref:Uncharacterized protein n=1 Tax=Coccidioides immitis H538.4 TaxID=396776 RepID=A0A0J8UPR9_COCIT|nr:hypothetical protein CIHG_07330 [Coccidioides immitis H538.4]
MPKLSSSDRASSNYSLEAPRPWICWQSDLTILLPPRTTHPGDNSHLHPPDRSTLQLHIAEDAADGVRQLPPPSSQSNNCTRATIMVSEEVFESCLPILNNAEVDEEEKVEKVEEFLRDKAALTGSILENAVLDVLWRHRNSLKGEASPPPLRPYCHPPLLSSAGADNPFVHSSFGSLQ